MDSITGISPTAVYNNHQKLLKDLKNGTISYQDSMSSYVEMRPQRRGVQVSYYSGYMDPDTQIIVAGNPEDNHLNHLTDEEYREHKDTEMRKMIFESELLSFFSEKTNSPDVQEWAYEAHANGKMAEFLQKRGMYSQAEDHIAASKAYKDAQKVAASSNAPKDTAFTVDGVGGLQYVVFDKYVVNHYVRHSYNKAAYSSPTMPENTGPHGKRPARRLVFPSAATQA